MLRRALLPAAIVAFSALLVTFVLALSFGGGELWSLVGVAALAALGLSFLAIAADVKVRLAIVRDLREGHPARALQAAEDLLRSARAPRSRTPFVICRATALSLLGRWDEGLAALEAIAPDELPRVNREGYRLFHLAALFECLVFSKRLDRARALFAERLEPLAVRLDTEISRLVLDECRAMLLFLDGELERSRGAFEALLGAEGVPLVTRAACFFFLGCIAWEKGDRRAAEAAFDEAVALAPRTYIPARVEQLRAGRRGAA